MNRFVMLTGAALLATAIASPVAFAETNSRTQQSAVIETQELVAPLGATCTLAQLETQKGCDIDTRDAAPKYPAAPVFPRFGF
ncbi:MAG: hypothetical protein AAF940_00305 [Pseudomonadota bacterium]